MALTSGEATQVPVALSKRQIEKLEASAAALGVGADQVLERLFELGTKENIVPTNADSFRVELDEEGRFVITIDGISLKPVSRSAGQDIARLLELCVPNSGNGRRGEFNNKDGLEIEFRRYGRNVFLFIRDDGGFAGLTMLTLATAQYLAMHARKSCQTGSTGVNS